VPGSKYKEGYFHLQATDRKAFNKKITEKEFHDTLNCKDMHQAMYGRHLFEHVRDMKSKQQLTRVNSQGSSSLLQLPETILENSESKRNANNFFTSYDKRMYD